MPRQGSRSNRRYRFECLPPPWPCPSCSVRRSAVPVPRFMIAVARSVRHISLNSLVLQVFRGSVDSLSGGRRGHCLLSISGRVSSSGADFCGDTGGATPRRRCSVGMKFAVQCGMCPRRLCRTVRAYSRSHGRMDATDDTVGPTERLVPPLDTGQRAFRIALAVAFLYSRGLSDPDRPRGSARRWQSRGSARCDRR